MSKDELFFGGDFDPESTEPINFVETRLQDLSPFSAHEVEVDGVTYKTAEHAYQSLRVVPNARERIIEARSPMDAWREGQKCKAERLVIENFNKEATMEKIFRAKLSQHEDVATVLLKTKDRELLKVYPDAYWGTGEDGGGKNVLGKIWMKLRAELREEQHKTHT